MRSTIAVESATEGYPQKFDKPFPRIPSSLTLLRTRSCAARVRPNGQAGGFATDCLVLSPFIRRRTTRYYLFKLLPKTSLSSYPMSQEEHCQVSGTVIQQPVTMKKNIYLSIMGTMGSGKTTVAQLLARELKFRVLEENFGENTFLPRFYQDMNRWAFQSQTFYLMEKITQLLATPKLLLKHSVIQDTPIQQDAFSYAKAQHVLGHMDDAEWKLYQKIYKSFEPYFPKPDLIVFLETSVTELVRRIASRGYEYEQAIPKSYVELLDMLNHKWLTENKTIPVLTVETDGLNVVRSKTAQGTLLAKIKTTLKL